jgi:hypothetical protein
MRKLLNWIPEKEIRKPRDCDARITITSDIVMVEYPKINQDIVLVKTDKRAIELLNTIKL